MDIIDLATFVEEEVKEAKLSPTESQILDRLDKIEYLLEQLIEKISDLDTTSGSGFGIEDLADYDS